MNNAIYGNPIKKQRELKLVTFLVALLTAAALFVPYMIMGRGYFIFFGDFNVQQIPFYKMCHAAVKSGNMKWSFTTDLGANFIGSYSFYLLGSPFFWTTLLFPNSFVPYLMGPLLILKFACAALTGYLYIRRFTRTPRAAMLGGLLYAFSGFSVYNIFFNHFHEAIIVFPLLLLSMELLINENRRGLFAFTVCLCAVTNYFFFFGMAVFCVIYYFVRVYTGDFKFKFSRFAALLFEAVLGVALAMFLLYPSLLAILGNGRVSEFLYGWNAWLYGREQIYLNIFECFFFPPDLPARPIFFPNANVKWSSLGGWLPLFGMTGVISWFILKKKTWIKKLLCILLFMALVPILNSAFYAFNSAYYARWFYMPILIMCLATATLCEDGKADLTGGFKWATAITVSASLIIGLFPQKDKDENIIYGLYTQDLEGTNFTKYWVTVIIASISIVLLGGLIHLYKNNRKRFIRASIISVCIISVLYGSVFIYFGKNDSYEIEDVMIDKLIENKVSLDGDKDTFRIDIYDDVDNTGMFLGYSTMNAFHSVVPASIMEYYEYLEINRDVASRVNLSYPAIREMLSVKYYLVRKGGKSFLTEDKKTKMPGYEYIKTSGGYYVYENKYFIPYGFSYDYAISNSLLKKYDSQAKSRMMLKAMLLSKKDMQKYADYIKDIGTSPAFNSEVNEAKTESEAAEIFSNAKVNDDLSLITDNEEMEKDCKRLAKTSAQSFSCGNGTFKATVKRDKKSLVFFSVPFDEGWSCKVNGKEAEIIKANVGFMAVAVEKGDSVIEFSYKTPGLFLGVTVSLGALLVFVVYAVISNIIIAKKKKEIYALGYSYIDEFNEKGEEELESQPENGKDLLDGLNSKDIDFSDESGKNDGGFNIKTDVFDDR